MDQLCCCRNFASDDHENQSFVATTSARRRPGSYTSSRQFEAGAPTDKRWYHGWITDAEADRVIRSSGTPKRTLSGLRQPYREKRIRIAGLCRQWAAQISDHQTPQWQPVRTRKRHAWSESSRECEKIDRVPQRTERKATDAGRWSTSKTGWLCLFRLGVMNWNLVFRCKWCAMTAI